MSNTFYDILNIVIRSTFAITILLFLTRIMGKKQISQLTFFDYVIGITIGTITASICIDESINIYKGIVVMVVLACFPILLSYITMKSYALRVILDGKPTVLIQNGKIIENNLKKSKLNINDLLAHLRMKNVFNVSDVESAVLETSGKFSVQLKSQNHPVTPTDLNISVTHNGLSTPLIIDGTIVDDNLNKVNKNKDWLINELKKQNINSVDKVLLAMIDSNNNLHIDKKYNDPTLIKL